MINCLESPMCSTKENLNKTFHGWHKNTVADNRPGRTWIAESGNPPAPNSSILAKKKTNSVGRQLRGYMKWKVTSSWRHFLCSPFFTARQKERLSKKVAMLHLPSLSQDWWHWNHLRVQNEYQQLSNLNLHWNVWLRELLKLRWGIPSKLVRKGYFLAY